jgi:hypothetical protein
MDRFILRSGWENSKKKSIFLKRGIATTNSPFYSSGLHKFHVEYVRHQPQPVRNERS